MRSFYQMDEIELRTYLFPIQYGLQLERWWYFEGELLVGSDMKYYFLVNGEQKYRENEIGGEDLSETN